MIGIYKKLFKLQGLTVSKDGKNPHFRSDYITLDNIVSVLTPLLQQEKLLVYHKTVVNLVVTVVTDIETGDSIQSDFPLVQDVNPQKLGSCITYAKRYNLSQLFNIVTDKDDDGNAASGNTDRSQTPEWDRKPEQETQAPVENKKYTDGGTKTENPEHGHCKCGFDKVKSPKTGKVFCSSKCWTK